MFLPRVGGVMSVVGGRVWSVRFGGLAWCGVFVFPGSSLIVSLGVPVLSRAGCARRWGDSRAAHPMTAPVHQEEGRRLSPGKPHS